MLSGMIMDVRRAAQAMPTIPASPTATPMITAPVSDTIQKAAPKAKASRTTTSITP